MTGEKKQYELTEAQKRIWYTQMLHPEAPLYNIGGVMMMEGRFDSERLYNAYKRTLFEADSLRIRVIEEQGKPMIYFADEESEVPILDFSKEEDGEKKAEQWERETFRKVFTRFDEPLYQAAFLKYKDGKYGCFLKIHHLIADGWSSQIIHRRIVENYESMENEIEDTEASGSYLTYIASQNKYVTSTRMEKDKEFWMDACKNLPDGLTEYSDELDAERKTYYLEPELSKRVKAYCSETNTSVNVFLLGAYLLLQSKWKNQKDIIIGVPVLGRMNRKERNIIGMCVSSLPYRIVIEKNETLEAFLGRVKKNMMALFAHQRYPLNRLVKDLKLEHTALYSTCFNYYGTQMESECQDGVSETREIFNGSQDYESQLIVRDWNDSEKIQMDFDYQVSAFTKEQIDAEFHALTVLLEKMLSNTNIIIGNLSLLGEKEEQKLVYTFNQQKFPAFSVNDTVVKLIGMQAERYPERIAVKKDGKSLTYQQLTEQSDQIAWYLNSKKVGQGEVVALVTEHSIETVTGILGILKAGAAYLPVDSHCPEERMEYMFADAGVKVVFTNLEGLMIASYTGEICSLKEEKLYTCEKRALPEVKPSDAAYVIYTSGSTGKPKGVLIEHHNLSNYIQWGVSQYVTREVEVFPLYSSLAFDLTVTSVFVPLVSGGRICVYADDKDEYVLNRILKDNECTVLKLTPSHMKLMEDTFGNTELEKFIIGGEDLTVDTAKRFAQSFEHDVILYNEYGPTEATVGCMCYAYNPATDVEGSVPVGMPIANSQIYILDQDENPVPMGCTGEMYIGGEGLAREYFHNEEMTKKSFVSCPFNGGRMYKTGDAAKFISETNIAYLGRIDQQIKIRGHRVELGEIETMLKSYDGIEDAVVDLKQVKGTDMLCAYYVCEEVKEESDLKSYLAESLPDYMVPALYTKIAEIPLTVNGKTDRKKLPVPEVSRHRSSKNRELSVMEKTFLQAVKKVLKVQDASIEDSFYYLGGDSIKAIQLSAELWKLDIKLSTGDILKYPELEDMAEHLTILAKEDAVKEVSADSGQAKEKQYPLTPMQEGMLYHVLTGEQAAAYVDQNTFIIEGTLDMNVLEEALSQMAERHEIFRARFQYENTETPKQVIAAEQNLSFTYEDAREFDEEKRESFVSDCAKEDRETPFDLAKGSLARMHVVRTSETGYTIIWTSHHIIMDGWCVEILVRELFGIYGALLNQQKWNLPEAASYETYVNWLEAQDKEKAYQYWENYLDGAAGANALLPQKKNQSGVFEKREQGLILEHSFMEKLQKTGAKYNATLHTVIETAWGILLQKMGRAEDVVFGSIVSGRPAELAGVENMMGLFINVIPVRIQAAKENSCKELFAEAQKDSVESLSYQYASLAEIQARTGNRELFDHILTFENYPKIEDFAEYTKSLNLGFKMSALKVEEQTNYDFNLLVETGECLNMHFVYNSAVYEEKTIHNVIHYFKNILEQVAENPEQKLEDISLLGEEEENEIKSFNQTDVPVPKDRLLHEYFEEQVLKQPEKTAITFENECLTYRALNNRANQIAGKLIGFGVKPDDFICVCVERSLEMMIGILAVLKAGGAYMPVDPYYPEERKSYILQDSQCKLVLTQSKFAEEFLSKGLTVLILDDESSYEGSTEKPKTAVRTENIAYVIYTSGSTGRPKGVMIEHRAIVNRIYWMWKAYGFIGDDRFIQKTPFTFDVSVWELFLWTYCGGSLHFLSRDEEKDAQVLAQKIKENNITAMHFVPSMLSAFLEYLEEFPEYIENLRSLRYLFASGEALLPGTVKRYFQVTKILTKRPELVNLYGPTEAAVDVTRYLCHEENPSLIPIGKPVWNVTCYIVDEKCCLLPVGVPGELCLAGIQVARGYVNQESLTKEKFMDCPFEQGTRMYRTGDLARWLPDGNIEYLGRIDRQVKLHGNRIELGEIESVLSEVPGISHALATLSETKRGTCLCAYYVSEQEHTEEELKEHLEEKLPSYMIPAGFMRLEKIPFTRNGKADYKALPEFEIVNERKIVEPATDTERKLEEIWKDVLQMDEISVVDSFYELGGHSLLLIRLMGRVQKEFGVRMEYGTFLKHSTIREFAKEIEQSEKQDIKQEELEMVVPDKSHALEPFPMTDIQLAYYIGRDKSYDLGGVATHCYLEMETNLEPERFEKSLNQLVERHAMLRTVFYENGTQQVLENQSYQMPLQDAASLDGDGQEQEIIAKRKEMSQFVFDPAVWPLFDIRLMKRKENKYRLFISIDMLIADEMSLKIMYRDFLHYYYDKGELPELNLTFRDYVLAYQKRKQSSVYDQDKEYWMDKLDDFPSAPKLPLRCEQTELKNVTFQRKEKLFSESITKQLKETAGKHHVTVSVLLLSVYAKVLQFWSGQERFAIDMTVFHRLPIHKEVGQIVGDFTSVLLADVNLESGSGFWKEASSLQETVMNGMAHRMYSGMEFLRELGKQNSQSGLVMMPIVFTSTLTTDSSYEKGSREENILDFNNVCMSLSQTSQVWIDCAVSEIGNELCVDWNYVEELFEPAVIENMYQQFVMEIELLAQENRFEPLTVCEEEQKEIERYNQTEKEFEITTLERLFVRAAEQYPDNTALILGEESMTYQKVNDASNQVAWYLKEQGVKAGDFIGVEVSRRMETIVNILGVLKAGAVYVPMDPDYPEQRIQYMKQNSNCVAILKPVLYKEKGLERFETTPCGENNSIHNIAYVIYTSGTTGNPKGVVITHEAAVNTIQDINEKYHVCEKDKVLGISSMCFDLSVYDIFGTLAAGAALVLAPEQRNIRKLNELVEKHGITIWNTVPATMEMLVSLREEDEAAKEMVYWSPVKQWEMQDGRLIIDGETYPESSNAYFPELYFLAQKGITKERAMEVFKDQSAIGLEELWNLLLQNHVLTDRILKPEELYASQFNLFQNRYEDAIIYNPDKYKGFKKEQLGRSRNVSSDYMIPIVETDGFTAELENRRSYRVYDETHAIPFSLFGKMLSVFRQKTRDNQEISYYYASAGGLYPIDIYIYIKEKRVEGLVRGVYFYDPCLNALKRIDSALEMNENAYLYTNKDIFNSAAFSIFFVYNAEANMPKYHGDGYFMAGIDTGIMVGALTQAAELSQIGLCSIGNMEFDQISDSFHLNKNQILLHSVLGGLKPENTVDLSVGTYGFKPEKRYVTQEEQNEMVDKEPYSGLRLVLLSGDWIPVTLPERIRKQFSQARVISLGGATEASIWSIHYEVRESMSNFTSIPYGMPLANQKIYVLNSEQEICPASVSGEIYIGGDGVARGYHNAKELTEKSFLHHPKLGYIYATGDYGVYHKEGYVEFLGRKDQQVKVKGHRIELSEIENALMQSELVRQAVVLTRKTSHGYIQITAFAVFYGEKNGTLGQLEQELKNRLPYYMVPAQILVLENLPLTSNGKIDRKALKAMAEKEAVEHVEQYESQPLNEIEERLLKIWKSVLKQEDISVEDNFFALGGDSLTVMNLSGKISSEFHVKLQLSKLFQQPTIRKLAEMIKAETKEIKSTEVKEPQIQEKEELDSLAEELSGLSEEELLELLK